MSSIRSACPGCLPCPCEACKRRRKHGNDDCGRQQRARAQSCDCGGQQMASAQSYDCEELQKTSAPNFDYGGLQNMSVQSYDSGGLQKTSGPTVDHGGQQRTRFPIFDFGGQQSTSYNFGGQQMSNALAFAGHPTALMAHLYQTSTSTMNEKNNYNNGLSNFFDYLKQTICTVAFLVITLVYFYMKLASTAYTMTMKLYRTGRYARVLTLFFLGLIIVTMLHGMVNLRKYSKNNTRIKLLPVNQNKPTSRSLAKDKAQMASCSSFNPTYGSQLGSKMAVLEANVTPCGSSDWKYWSRQGSQASMKKPNKSSCGSGDWKFWSRHKSQTSVGKSKKPGDWKFRPLHRSSSRTVAPCSSNKWKFWSCQKPQPKPKASFFSSFNWKLWSRRKASCTAVKRNEPTYWIFWSRSGKMTAVPSSSSGWKFWSSSKAQSIPRKAKISHCSSSNWKFWSHPKAPCTAVKRNKPTYWIFWSRSGEITVVPSSSSKWKFWSSAKIQPISRKAIVSPCPSSDRNFWSCQEFQPKPKASLFSFINWKFWSHQKTVISNKPPYWKFWCRRSLQPTIAKSKPNPSDYKFWFKWQVGNVWTGWVTSCCHLSQEMKNLKIGHTSEDDVAREVMQQSKLFSVPVEMKRPPQLLVYLRDILSNSNTVP